MTRLLYRTFRALKSWMLARPRSWLSTLFFLLLARLNVRLSPRHHVDKSDLLLAEIWKQFYWQRFGVDPLYRVVTNWPIARDSDDQKWPSGTLFDNSSNPRFNIKLKGLMEDRAHIRLLDLGCAGGGLVRSLLSDGCFSLGVEGSDVSRRYKMAEWATCPWHLLTADITQPFTIVDNADRPVLFNVVTAWEVLEHIPEAGIPVLIENVLRHLGDGGGFFIASVALFPDGNPLTGAVYHKTLQPKEWWLKQFRRHGFREISNHPFLTEDFVRGNGSSVRDWDPRDGSGFHLVLRRD